MFCFICDCRNVGDVKNSFVIGNAWSQWSQWGCL